MDAHTGHRILIADDESYILSVLSTKFRERGYAVRATRDSEEALAMAREEPPDLIVSDFQIPPIDGLELARLLRKDAATAEIPIVLLTACAHRISVKDLEGTNIKVVVDKPFSAQKLIAKASQILAERAGNTVVPSR